MTRRRLPLTLAVVGVLIILAAVVAASVLRSSDTATLTLGERPDVPVVVTAPGVLDAVDPDVTVRATAEDDQPVVLAIGRTAEVEAWLGDADHARVTGLSSWEELTVEVVTGQSDDAATPAPTETPTDAATPAEEGAEPTTLPNPAGSDLWVVEAAGTGAAELSWTDSPGRWSLVAATDGSAPAPELELEWGRQVSTPWLVPVIVVGALAFVAGATLLALDVLARREERRREEARSRREAAGDDLPTVSITDTDPGTGERLTRRQIREMERAMARAERNRAAGEALPPPVPLAPGEEEDDDAAEAPGLVTDAATTSPSEEVGTGDRPAASADDAPGTEEWAASEDDGTTSGPGPDAEQAEAVEADEPTEEDEEDAPAPPSWRSVWGFGAGSTPAAPAPEPAPGASTEPATEQHDDGEERR